MRKLQQIERRLRRVQVQMKKEAMREGIRLFQETGELPDSEPALSFALLTQAFHRMADASVGGDDNEYQEAVESYRAAEIRWNNMERGIEWM